MSIMNKRKEEQEKLEKAEAPVRRVLSESEKVQYEKCKICKHSYWWGFPGSDNRELRCRFLFMSGVLTAMKPGIECELFEENLGCMYCVHRRSEPRMIINGEKFVICERARSTVNGFEVNLGWESLDEGKKCGSYCRKEEKE